MPALRAPWREPHLRAGAFAPGPGGCAVCRALAPHASAEAELLLHHDDHTATLLAREPLASGHVVVAPRRHVVDLGTLPADEAAALIAAVQQALRRLEAALGASAFNVGFNLGEAAGAATGEHLQAHVVPRWPGDTGFLPVVADARIVAGHLPALWALLRPGFTS